MLSAKQTGQDGLGVEKELKGSGVRLKAKSILTTKSTKLIVTGLNTGATWTVDVIVRPGGRIYFTPPAEEYSPSLPVADFSYNIGNNPVADFSYNIGNNPVADFSYNIGNNPVADFSYNII